MLRQTIGTALRTVTRAAPSRLAFTSRTALATGVLNNIRTASIAGARSIHTSYTTSSTAATAPSASTTTEPLPTVNLAKDSKIIEIQSPTGSKYHRPQSTKHSTFWLRDNCPCPECIHPSTRQKLHTSTQIPLDLGVASYNATPEGLEIVWSKGLEDTGDWEAPEKGQPGHRSVYPWEMVLGSYGGTPTEHRTESRMNHKPILWDKELMESKTLWLDYNEYMNTPEGLLKGLKHLQDYGLFFLEGVPREDQEVAVAAERIGHLRHTFYGRTWDVKSVPNAKNVAYTNLNLGLHMDLLYLEAPPGLQLLHSLENSVPGGTSIFMDSFKAVQLLRDNHPEDYEVLLKTPTTFHYKNANHHLHYNRPTIVVDPLNDALTVNYSPPFQGPLELPPQEMEAYYKALKKFAGYIEQEDLQFRHTMRPGQCMVFANRRVLHARTAFDPTKGKRHLKGCYVDLDMFKDKYRTTLQAKADGQF
ncbi:hypothetical protein BGZ96_002024 [Linnemannia gamsii]|uniref:Gamma-butyrobetaine dioxygenase n=1 Tax=Linnemannia gamsii TaxID=64522 RepID=A0ABQ7JLM9_9FUNG|nr:hypothetical protein BGZ96_002024 [Linnemannia gamsii]